METNNKKPIEIAVIFKRKENKDGISVFIPQKIVLGNISETKDYNVFQDINGTIYKHISIIDSKACGFGLRITLKELREIYQIKSTKELFSTYLKHLKQYNYYFTFPSLEDVDIEKLTFVAQDKKYDNMDIMLDMDFELIKKASKETINIDTNQLINKIKSKIIGQDEAIENIVSIIWQNNRSNRISNMLIIGPSGTGKTEIFRLIANELKKPMVIANAASMTQSGYVGESVDEALKNLLNVCGGDVKKAEHGIIVLDEIDKLAKNGLSGEKVATSGVQDELLKLTEDGTYHLKMGEWPEEKTISINTKNIMFIGVGAFADLEVKQIPDKKICGFGQKQEEPIIEKNNKITTEDLIKYGLKPELVGRMPIIIQFNPLTKENLIQIMKNPNNDTINEKFKILSELGIVPTIDESVYDKLAEIAIKKGVGARGIVGSVETLFSKAMLEVSKNESDYSELIITNETIENPKSYKLVRKKEKEGQNN